ncbi:Fbp26p [Saccharomyces cerevisiae AWRI796]|nr:Fbp26p [Saccharomyces cerevisiae AWRI796]
MFLESWSNDHELIINNAKDIGSTSPDYENFEPHVAEADFLERIRQYERFYEPLDPQKDKDMTFIKLVNIIEEVVINKIRTYLESRIVFYVMNIRPKPKYIWLSRHGESIYNVEKKIRWGFITV